MTPNSSGATSPAIVWHRQDLRLADHSALHRVLHLDQPFLPIFVWDEAQIPIGAAPRWWLAASLRALQQRYRARGVELLVLRGDSLTVLDRLVRQLGASRLLYHRCYEPQACALEAAIESRAPSWNVTVEAYDDRFLLLPEQVRRQRPEPYRIFTSFWQACWRHRRDIANPLADPHCLPIAALPSALSLEHMKLDPLVEASPLQEAPFQEEPWMPGEDGAHQRLTQFLCDSLAQYPMRRDRPSIDGTSRLSPHLHFGEITPRQVWHAVLPEEASGPWARASRGALAFLRQLGWREFALHTLTICPQMGEHPMRTVYDRIPWLNDAAMLMRWQEGRTGYPLVDAGMRQLRRTGWLPNRVRMVTASFLVKHLLIDWRQGAQWFLQMLVDADLANNALGWQWVTGYGFDAVPAFRIFNPVRQSMLHDPDGTYIRRWVPELASLPAPQIHEPWTCAMDTGKTSPTRRHGAYPSPCVDLAMARERALYTYAQVVSRSRIRQGP
ncbi:MAG: deoxyribodipyrimidine photo-lyase [Nitrospirae bacterium]|nr:MAG: deoxyribodipyrimidine photo-lyase [Nitrospirota bacterium]